MPTLQQEIRAELTKTQARSSFPSDLIPVNKLAGLNMQKGKEPENDLEKWQQEVRMLEKTLAQVKCTPKTPLRKQQIHELGLRIQKAIKKVAQIKKQLGLDSKPRYDINRCFVQICHERMPRPMFETYLKLAQELSEKTAQELLTETKLKD